MREIEASTLAHDPRFAAQLDLHRVTRHRRRLRVLCWWLLGIGAVLTWLGAGNAHGLIPLGTTLARRRMRVDALGRGDRPQPSPMQPDHECGKRAKEPNVCSTSELAG